MAQKYFFFLVDVESFTVIPWQNPLGEGQNIFKLPGAERSWNLMTVHRLFKGQGLQESDDFLSSPCSQICRVHMCALGGDRSPAMTVFINMSV
jgi:hypothetical protein